MLQGIAWPNLGERPLELTSSLLKALKRNSQPGACGGRCIASGCAGGPAPESSQSQEESKSSEKQLYITISKYLGGPLATKKMKDPPVASSSQLRLGSCVHGDREEGTREDEDKDGEAEDLHCKDQEAGGRVVTWVLASLLYTDW